ncbi:MAG: peptidoglycan DD-metalloendopeptidase family protein [Acidaminococcales bacterium]|jgi:murein DD-endopeptidase MepM/ murein hydrolase activator NlpD|nr:peptidoglycan DD-metalloendopeptidase family protein [Acidaminococcales bacterium]
MFTKRKIYALTVITALILSFLQIPALAQVSSEDQEKIREKQEELKGIQNQMGDKRQAVDSTREKARTAYDELRVVERELAQAEDELLELQSALNKVETQMRDNEKFLRESVKQLADRTQSYNKRIRNIYMHGQINYLDVLLGANDFTDFTTRFQLLTRIIKNDITLIDEIKKDQLLVQKQQEELAAGQEKIARLRDSAAAKQQIVSGHRRQRRTAFDAAAAERNQAEREYNELMAISERITDMIRRLEANGQPIGKGTGSMDWPLRGPITSPYGWRIHPIFGSQKFHAGLDISANYGDPVKAADEGVVISAGWLGGYGYTVMIDHGGGIITLYAHNSELTVSAGEMVLKGQTVALAGSTGYATGPHCHFEVRIHGQTADPLNYLP